MSEDYSLSIKDSDNSLFKILNSSVPVDLSVENKKKYSKKKTVLKSIYTFSKNLLLESIPFSGVIKSLDETISEVKDDKEKRILKNRLEDLEYKINSYELEKKKVEEIVKSKVESYILKFKLEVNEKLDNEYVKIEELETYKKQIKELNEKNNKIKKQIEKEKNEIEKKCKATKSIIIQKEITEQKIIPQKEETIPIKETIEDMIINTPFGEIYKSEYESLLKLNLPVEKWERWKTPNAYMYQLIKIENYHITKLKLDFKDLSKKIITITELINLNELYLSNNKIEKIPETISQLKNLRELNLSYNQINKIPKEIGQLTNLRRLHLFSNKLIKVPEEIGQLTNLKELNLSLNNITHLPKEIGQLKNLQKLYLTQNQIEKIPETISQLKNLQRMVFKNNKINNIPKEIGQLKNLRDLILEDNLIEKIPETISQLKNLKELNLSYNQINKIPKEISQLENLLSIKLINNLFSKDSIIPIEILQSSKLYEIDLSSNKIKTKHLPKEIRNQTKIKIII